MDAPAFVLVPLSARTGEGLMKIAQKPYALHPPEDLERQGTSKPRLYPPDRAGGDGRAAGPGSSVRPRPGLQAGSLSGKRACRKRCFYGNREKNR